MNEEPIIKVLRRRYEASAQPFQFDLVKLCYDVEKQYQYDTDRSVALNELRKLVEEAAHDAAATGEVSR
jgi:hypothetical protein